MIGAAMRAAIGGRARKTACAASGALPKIPQVLKPRCVGARAPGWANSFGSMDETVDDYLGAWRILAQRNVQRPRWRTTVLAEGEPPTGLVTLNRPRFLGHSVGLRGHWHGRKLVLAA